MYPMTDGRMAAPATEQLDALVGLARSVRPSWDVPGIRNAIRQALARETQPTLAELAYALIRCAENPTINTPAVVAMDGAHWKTGLKDGADVERSKKHADCGEWHILSQPCPPWSWMRQGPSSTEAAALAEMRVIATRAKRPPDQTVERARTYAGQTMERDRQHAETPLQKESL